ncbi:hypothetical protein [Desulfonema magnum]|uniref:Uncharacterized protein n=1 Tax=Desulfonema magnum TaxID=45655 RepID=A0A975BGJ3_9BACT|nr:hypothetical protein [Desulfonema magnum]QTA84875.1 Uncharacterized protein dnm_008780 [Desulfonema magnum]
MHKNMSDQNETDNQVPGGVYLCQVSETLSCGACCGLYNVADPSREALTEMLISRTRAFEKVPRNTDAILDFGQETGTGETQDRPFPDFHHCPYIGLAGRNNSRVGCLLHPMAKGNNGVDFRGLSFYGGMACRIYFCPSYRCLPAAYKDILRHVSEDWYLYGLMITETEMVSAFFSEVETRLGRLLKKEDIVGNEKRTEIIREFLRLKTDWPFRSGTSKNLCNYFFEDKLYSVPPVNYADIGTTPSRYDPFLKALRSSFDSADALQRAESLLDQLFERLVQSLF